MEVGEMAPWVKHLSWKGEDLHTQTTGHTAGASRQTVDTQQ